MSQDQARQEQLVTISAEEKEALVYVKGVKDFYDHLLVYAVMFIVYGGLFVLIGFGGKFVPFGLAGWGIGVIIHGLVAFEKISLWGLGVGWEKRAIEKRLGRKL